MLSNCWESNRGQENQRERERRKRKIIMGDKSQAGCQCTTIFSVCESICIYERWDIWYHRHWAKTTRKLIFFSYYSWMSFFRRLFVLVSVHERLLSLKDHLSRRRLLFFITRGRNNLINQETPLLRFLFFFCFNHFYPRHTVQLRCNILNNQTECTDMSVGE